MKAFLAVGELLLVLQVQEVSSELILRDLVRCSLGVVGQLPDRSKIARMRAFTHSAQMQIL